MSRENCAKADDKPSLNKRQKKIQQLVRQQGFASIESLVQHFQKTPQTIRRDLNTLSQLGLLTRYHGGAGLPSSVRNVAYQERKIFCLEEKQRIANLLVQHIPNDASLFINIGTTNEQIAMALKDHDGLRVITNNLNVAYILSRYKNFEIIITGGVVRHRDRGITGEATLEFVNQFKVDYAIIGISGIENDGSLLDFDYREVKVAQAIMANSRAVYLAVDHSKFSRNAMVRLGHVSAVDAIFTDRALPENFVSIAAEAGTQLYVAD
ncbi:MAG TPA: DeoR family transcriptional regulator [Gammaproteobacteria bacterium]|nr:DeoR family transcriptional regulator [Gammaproteobacteria bacterium]